MKNNDPADSPARPAIAGEAESRNHQLQLLLEAAQQIHTRLEIPAILRRLVVAAMGLTGAEGGAAGLMAEGRMVFTEYHRQGQLIPIDYRFYPGRGVSGWVIQSRVPYLSDDAEHDPRVIPEFQQAFGFHRLANVPILSAKGDLLGCVEVHNRADRRPFDAGDAGVLEELAASAAVALENARLLELVQREPAELEQVEDVLRGERMFSHALLDSLPGLFYLYSYPALRLMRWNRSHAILLGYQAEEVKDRHLLEWVKPEDRDRVRQAVERVMENGQGEIEARLLAKNGRPVPFLLTGARVESQGQRYLMGVGIDLTRRRQAEEEVHRLNRELRALSDCNQALIRATDEETLLKEVCRIICEVAGYCLAWVGFAEHDAARTVRVAGWGGREDGYLANAKISWADAEPGRGPTGTSIRTGKTYYAQDFLTDSGMALWRDAALQRGYRSNIALPMLGENGAAFGALTVYSTQPHAFTPKEIRLLEELTGDLAFGIIGLRARAEHRRAEEALRFTQFAVDKSADGAHWVKSDGRFVYVNDEFCRSLGYTREELLLLSVPDIDPDKTRETWAEHWRKARKEGTTTFESRHRTKAGNLIPVEIRANFLEFSGEEYHCAFSRDLTERKRAEEEREKLQGQLVQAQKMEAVGRLAGGVAHDFNNMLQAILGNASLALQDLPPDSPLRESLEEIQKSAERSTDLTRQLLAFARKQTIQPKVLDLNDAVAGMLKMLRRLIGEDVDLAWVPGPDLWPVKLDPSQIDQILANLCANARDALAANGKITIETGNATLDDTYARTRPECAPGDYVMLMVSDTGHGMDDQTRAHLFEPFFTTKEVGKGTGLGLATVFGIVKQNRGLINVYSETGQGTTFKIYLPRAEVSEVMAEQKIVRQSLRGNETLLLVEDEEQILNLGRRILSQQGYTVLVASRPEAAMVLAARHAGAIHLLITDVVMPGMNGKELLQRLRAAHPELKCLFMSGYTANVIAHHGVLDAGVQFLQKPFTIHSLSARVRELLDQHLES